MNVASACVPGAQLLETAQGIAREIAQKVPLAVRAAKRSFTPGRGPAAARRLPLRAEPDRGAVFHRGHKEAQRAFAEKRKPVFKGR